MPSVNQHTNRRNRRPAEGRSYRESDVYTLILHVLEAPPAFSWQVVKDDIRRTTARVRRVHDNHLSSGVRYFTSQISGRENAIRTYDKFVTEGLAGFLLSVVLVEGTEDDDPHRIRGPTTSQAPGWRSSLNRRDLIPPTTAEMRHREWPFIPSRLACTSAMIVPTTTPHYQHGAVQSFGTTTTTAARPTTVSSPQTLHMLSTWNAARSAQSTAPGRDGPMRNPPSTALSRSPRHQSAVLIITTSPHNVQGYDIISLLRREHIPLPALEVIGHATIRASFPSLESARTAKLLLNRSTIQGNRVEASYDRSSTNQTRQAATRPPRRPRPDATPVVPSTQQSRPQRPLIVDGSGGSPRRVHTLYDSDDD